FAFDIPDKWGDNDAVSFAVNVSQFCSLAAGQHTGVVMFTVYDAQKAPLRRILVQPIVGRFRKHLQIIPPDCIARFFSDSFCEFTLMKQSGSRWSKLVSYCCSIEESIYLEQKMISLLTALEFFLKNYLIEKEQSEQNVNEADLTALIGWFRRVAGQPIPSEYSEHDIRMLRNQT